MISIKLSLSEKLSLLFGIINEYVLDDIGQAETSNHDLTVDDLSSAPQVFVTESLTLFDPRVDDSLAEDYTFLDPCLDSKGVLPLGIIKRLGGPHFLSFLAKSFPGSLVER
jgi:hypothetical protein